PQEDRDVVAIAGPDLQQASRGVEQLDAEDVARIANPAPYEVQQGAGLPQSVLAPYAVAAEHLDGLLSHVEVPGALLHEPGDDPGCHQRAAVPLGDADDANPRHHEPREESDHSHD